MSTACTCTRTSTHICTAREHAPCVPPQIEELPYDYYVCVGLTALLLPCMLVLLSLWAPGKAGRTPKPKQKAK